jgi:hypothetical protein
MMPMNVLADGLIGITDFASQICMLKQKYSSNSGDYPHLPGRTWWIVWLKANGQLVARKEVRNASVLNALHLDICSVPNGWKNEIMALVRLEE